MPVYKKFKYAELPDIPALTVVMVGRFRRGQGAAAGGEGGYKNEGNK